VSNEVVPALAPHVDVLAAVTGTTLDLLHVVVRGRPGLLVRCTTAGRGRRHHWPLVQARGAYGRRGLYPGRCWDPLSPAGGVGTLSSSPTTLLGGGVLAASSSLVGVLAAALAGTGCSLALVAAAVTAGCSVACGAASPMAATCSAVLCSATWSGLTSDAALNNETTYKQC